MFLNLFLGNDTPVKVLGHTRTSGWEHLVKTNIRGARSTAIEIQYAYPFSVSPQS